MGERTKNMASMLSARAEKEAKDVRAVLEELERNLLAELDAKPPDQLPLFTPPEREQFERNRGSIAARIARIPAEIEREVAALRARYADPVPRLFPVSVSFLVPEAIDREAR